MNFIERMFRSIRLSLSSVKKRHRRHMRVMEAMRWAVLDSLELRMMMSTLYWNPSTLSGLHAGSGTWDTTTPNWSTTTAGTDHVNWTSSNDNAVFSVNGSSTITISGTQGANSITFSGTGYTITGGANITLTGSASITANANATISSIIAGSAGLTCSGTATLTLTGNNIYTNGTIISAGTLQIGNNSGTGSLGGGDIANNGTLLINRGNYIISGIISGSGGLSIIGAGTVTLTANNTYTGATTINGSFLKLSGVGTLGGSNGSYSSLTITSGYLILNGTSQTIDALNGPTGCGYIINNSSNSTSTLTVGASGGSGAFGGILSSYWPGTIALTKAGTGTQVFTAGNTYAGTTTISGGVLQVGTANSTSGTLGTGNIVDNATLSINRGGPYTLSGNITGIGNLIQAGSGATTLTGNNNGYSGTVTINACGTLQVGSSSNSGTLGTGTIINNGTLIFNRNDSITVTNVLSGTGKFSEDNGSETILLTGANTYSGTMEIKSGTLRAGNANELGNGSAGLTIILGTFDMNGASQQIGALNGGNSTGQIVNNMQGTTAVLTVGTGDTGGTYIGAIKDNSINPGGRVALTKIGTGTLILTGANTYTGSIIINGGTLQVGNGGSGGTLGGGNVTDNGVLAFGMGGTLSVPNVITGSGSVVQQAGGMIILSGPNGYKDTTILNGCVQLSGAGRLGTGGLTLNGGTLDLHGNSQIVDSLNGNSVNATITNSLGSQVILTIGDGGGNFMGMLKDNGGATALSLIKSGTATLTLSGSNSYSGTTTIGNGVLQIGAGGDNGSLGTGNVVNNATLVINHSNANGYGPGMDFQLQRLSKFPRRVARDLDGQ